MGRWTPDLCDDVLKTKMKSLVSGAIRRSRLSKTDPKITYERFVDELDAGDSFTTTLLELLVNEVAERHTRSSADKRYISERTAKELRMLASPRRIWRDASSGPRIRRHVGGPRASSFTQYIPAPGEVDMEEDSDSFQSILDNVDTTETPLTTRIGDYDIVVPTIPSTEELTSAVEDTNDPLRVLSPPTLPSSSSMGRQAIIHRRPYRSRTVDFHDHTLRRRASWRDTYTINADPLEAPYHLNTATRRFFPPFRSRHSETSWTNDIWRDGATSDEAEDDSFHNEPTPSSSATWIPHFTVEGGILTEVAPRLRRGGVRAPESIVMSRTASPIPINTGRMISRDTEITSTSEQGDSAVATYPTPGSIENEPPQ